MHLRQKKKKDGNYTHQPFLVTLETLLVKPLDSNNSASSRLSSLQEMLIDPSFENAAKSTFTHHTVGTEVPGGCFKFIEAEILHIGGLQYLTLCPGS